FAACRRFHPGSHCHDLGRGQPRRRQGQEEARCIVSGQLLSSKIVIVEEEPKVRGIPSVPTSIAGAVGLTKRKPIGEAVLCSSFDKFQTKFNGFTPDSDL